MHTHTHIYTVKNVQLLMSSHSISHRKRLLYDIMEHSHWPQHRYSLKEADWYRTKVGSCKQYIYMHTHVISTYIFFSYLYICVCYLPLLWIFVCIFPYAIKFLLNVLKWVILGFSSSSFYIKRSSILLPSVVTKNRNRKKLCFL